MSQRVPGVLCDAFTCLRVWTHHRHTPPSPLPHTNSLAGGDAVLGQIELFASFSFWLSLAINILILLAYSVVFWLLGNNMDGQGFSRSDLTARLEVSDLGSAPLSTNSVHTLLHALGTVQAALACVILVLYTSNFGGLASGTRLV